MCLALAGADYLGNASVSAPIRLCLDADLDENDGCPVVDEFATSGMPNCTGTYSQMTGLVDSGDPCVMNNSFPANEVRRTDL